MALKRSRTCAAITVVVVSGLALGCGNAARSPTQPSSPASSTVAGPSPAPGNPSWMTGKFTWTSIVASRTMCPELTNQVGQSWVLSASVQRNGDSVTVLLAEGPPPKVNDPMADPPEAFEGTIQGNTITASNQSLLMGMSCPNDKGITRETGGELSAVFDGQRIAGNYTDVFGSGPDAVTFTYSFSAEAAATSARTAADSASGRTPH